jgi:hypothetical protein
MAIRFRSRHLHATFVEDVTTKLTELGWIPATPSTPVNFGTTACTVVDYQPDERIHAIVTNTVAVSLADYTSDEDEELGAAYGGLRGAPYSVFIDVYMAEQSLSLAITDDIRDAYTDRYLPLTNQITQTPVPDVRIAVENVVGPERPSAQVGAEQFKKFWRTMRLDTRLYFNT